MVRYIRIACPQCQHRQSLRTEFLGRRLCCGRCHHNFKLRIVLPCKRCRSDQLIKLANVGQEVPCEQCGRHFEAEIWIACPRCRRDLKIRPEYIGHRVNCKGCRACFRVLFADRHIELLPTSPGNVETNSVSDVGPEDSCVAFASPSHNQEAPESPIPSSMENSSLLPVFVSTERIVVDAQEPAAAELKNARQESQPNAETLCAGPRDFGNAGDLLRDQPVMLESNVAENEALKGSMQAEHRETVGFRTELADRQTRTGIEQEASNHKEQELHSLKAERAQLTEEIQQLRHRLDGSSQQMEPFSASVRTLRDLQVECDQLRMEKSQWQEKCDAYVRDAEQLRTELDRVEFDRSQEQQKAEIARVEVGRLANDVNQLQELTVALRAERDTAVQHLDVLPSAQSCSRQATAEPLPREAEDRLQAEIVSLKEALKRAAEQERTTAQRVTDLSDQNRLKEMNGQEQRRREEKLRQELRDSEERLRLAEAKATEHQMQLAVAQRSFDEDYRRLKGELACLTKANTALRDEQTAVASARKQLDQSQRELINQVQDLQSQLAQQGDRAAVLQRELEHVGSNAAVERERLASLLAEERARVRNEKQEGQVRLAAASQQFGQERKMLQDSLQQVQEEAGVLRLERTDLLGRIADLTQEISASTLKCDALKTACQNAENRLQSEVARLSHTFQQTQEHVQKLRGALEQQQLRNRDFQRDLAALEQDRDLKGQAASDAAKQLEDLRKVFEEERQGFAKEIERLRQQVTALGQEREALPAAEVHFLKENDPSAPLPAKPVPGKIDLVVSAEATRLSELAARIEALAAELDQRHGTKPAPLRLGRALAALARGARRLWGSPAVVTEEFSDEPLEPECRLRALWTEVMSHREHALRRNAEAVYAGLEQQIANLRSQFEAATERADRLEAELQAARGPMAAEKES